MWTFVWVSFLVSGMMSGAFVAGQRHGLRRGFKQGHQKGLEAAEKTPEDSLEPIRKALAEGVLSKKDVADLGIVLPEDREPDLPKALPAPLPPFTKLPYTRRVKAVRDLVPGDEVWVDSPSFYHASNGLHVWGAAGCNAQYFDDRSSKLRMHHRLRMLDDGSLLLTIDRGKGFCPFGARPAQFSPIDVIKVSHINEKLIGASWFETD